MRGAVLARRGKTILTIQSTAENGSISRIVPFLQEGAGVTLNETVYYFLILDDS